MSTNCKYEYAVFWVWLRFWGSNMQKLELFAVFSHMVSQEKYVSFFSYLMYVTMANRLLI